MAATSKRFLTKLGLDNNNNTIINVSDPVNAQDAATKNFSSNASNLTSGTIANARFPTSLGLGATPIAGTTLDISTVLSGAANGIAANIAINPLSTVTAGAYGVLTTSFNVTGQYTPNVFHHAANQGTYAGTSPIGQYGFYASPSLVGASNNFGFYGDIPSGVGTARYNLYMNGTADNYLAGNLWIGTNSGSEKLEVLGNIKLTGTTETLTKTSTIDGWTYSGKSVSISAQETASRGISFSTDGTKMYIVGQTSDSVFQYTLSTPFDVSTATYSTKSFSVLTQDTASTSLFFKPDGTVFYMLGDTVDTVFQFTLTTAWDISTAAYSKACSVTTQETAPSGLVISTDGTKMYVIGSTNDTVYQYTLSTAWDVSTATYASKSFSVTTFDGTPTGVEFNNDGTKMYVVGSGYDCVIEYTLSTGWDVSTAVFTDRLIISNGISSINPNSFSAGNSPQDIYTDFTNNVAYILDLSTQRVWQFTTNTTPLKVSGNKLVVNPFTYFKNDIATLGSIRALGLLEVTNAATFSGAVSASSSVTVGGALSVSSTLTASNTITLNGATTTATTIGTAATTGTTTIGGASQTGAITFGQSTVSQTVNIASGATTNVSTKTVNIGTAGVAGSITNINIGSATSTSTVAISANVGIGLTTTTYKLEVNGTAKLSDLTTVASKETKVAMAANNVDLSTGNYFSKTISGATTLTVSNVPATGTAISFILDLTNGGSAAITWWTGVKWASGTAPTLTAAGRDVLGFFTHDGGTTWTGLVLGKDVK